MADKLATSTLRSFPARITERQLGISSFTGSSTFDDLVDALPDEGEFVGYSKRDAWQLLLAVTELSGTDGLVPYHDLAVHLAKVRPDVSPVIVLELTSLLLDTGFLNCM